MFLLLLMGLGAASVKAQVRIGGDAVPNPAAVLDLNADDTNSGAKGLALPRVSLTDTLSLLNGNTPLAGMLVYDTNATLGSGIYFWSGKRWVLANLPATAAADTNTVLLSTAAGWQLVRNTSFNSTSYTLTTPWALPSLIVLKSSIPGYGLCTWHDTSCLYSGPGESYYGSLTLFSTQNATLPTGTGIQVNCIASATRTTYH